jgi:hypothetical protein
MLAAAMIGLVALLTMSTIPGPARSAVLAQSSDTSSAETSVAEGAWSQTFDGTPAAPTPWNPADRDIQVHSNDLGPLLGPSNVELRTLNPER